MSDEQDEAVRAVQIACAKLSAHLAGLSAGQRTRAEYVTSQPWWRRWPLHARDHWWLALGCRARGHRRWWVTLWQCCPYPPEHRPLWPKRP